MHALLRALSVLVILGVIARIIVTLQSSSSVTTAFATPSLKGQPNAAIVYLTTGDSKYLSWLAGSIVALEKNFNQHRGYPYVIFCSNVSQSAKHHIAALVRNVTFVDVVLDLPLPRSETIPPTQTCKGWSWPHTYLHMCRFFIYYLFLEPILKNYDFIWRLDSDLFLEKPAPLDPIQFVALHKLTFAFYAQKTRDPVGCTYGLLDTAYMYAELHKLQPVHLARLLPGTTYSGAFAVMDVRFFTSEKFIAFAKFVHDTGGIWKHRWGEQAFYPVALGLFERADAIWWFGGWQWTHKGKPIWSSNERLAGGAVYNTTM